MYAIRSYYDLGPRLELVLAHQVGDVLEQHQSAGRAALGIGRLGPDETQAARAAVGARQVDLLRLGRLDRRPQAGGEDAERRQL